jgi:hypothetical protein
MTRIVLKRRPSLLNLPALLGLVLFVAVVPRGVWSQTADPLASPPSEMKVNPFSGFETFYLSNGLKVWFKQMPQAPTSPSASVCRMDRIRILAEKRSLHT